MPFADALSEHPIPSHAVGEVVGEVLDKLGPAPDLAVLFAGAAHTGAMDDIVRAVNELLEPTVLVGCTASTVVGRSREVEDAGGLSLWAATGMKADAYTLRVDGSAIRGFPAADEIPDDASALLVIADPFTFPTEELLVGLREQAGINLPVIGGLASAARGPGGNRLVRDHDVRTDGAVLVVLRAVEIETVVSQGCRPIGDPMIVTAGEGRVARELAGRPALERVQEILRGLSPDDLQLAQRGLHVGLVVDESKATFDRGDFLVRTVLGADSSNGAVAFGEEVEVGATVQLHVRDATSADEDLRHLMAGRDAHGALVFTCNGRGTQLFGVEDHDAIVVNDALGSVPIAGMSCAGEIGPVGGRSHLHGFTASIALFRHR
ncbi:MAG TPA: FIST N-terminal domain-containing protein [Acidimicrobiales bacterium]|nr:FIST N-terminal domain-containing protein [Acidimicrobiales bacterium]